MKPNASRRARILFFLCLAALCFAADLATKHWIFAELGEPGARPIWWQIENVFGFQTSLNQGALFGIGQGQIVLFVSLSAVALVGILAWVFFDASRSWFLTTALALTTGGVLGNLWDRVGLHGMRWTQFDADAWSCPQTLVGEPIYAVRDWILVMIGDYAWPNFNIADSCLVVGAILIGVYACFAPSSSALRLEEPVAAEVAEASTEASSEPESEQV